MFDDDPAAGDLHGAMVAAYPGYVASRLEALGVVPPSGWEDAVAAGLRRLDDALRDLLALPPEAQGRSPLEVFQEALAEPTAVLETAGVPPVRRDPAAESALPGDRYDLAPASSQDLGEEAWMAHLRWGAAKAAAMRRLVPPSRPVAGLFGADLMDRSRIESAADAAGYQLVVWRSLDRVTAPRPPAIVFVDLVHPEADDAVRTLAAAGVRVIGYGPHVDDLAMARAGSLGAAEALARSRFFARLPSLFPAVT